MTRAFTRNWYAPAADFDYTQNPKESPMSMSPETVATIRASVDALRAAGRANQADALEATIPVKAPRTVSDALDILKVRDGGGAEWVVARGFLFSIETELESARAAIGVLTREAQGREADFTRTRRDLAALRNNTKD